LHCWNPSAARDTAVVELAVRRLAYVPVTAASTSNQSFEQIDVLLVPRRKGFVPVKLMLHAQPSIPWNDTQMFRQDNWQPFIAWPKPSAALRRFPVFEHLVLVYRGARLEFVVVPDS